MVDKVTFALFLVSYICFVLAVLASAYFRHEEENRLFDEIQQELMGLQVGQLHNSVQLAKELQKKADKI